MKINLNKIQVAEIQLNEAIFLFFDNANPVVVETLVGAVIGILRPLGKKYGVTAPIHDSDMIKPEHKTEWIRDYLHKAQSYFKHADRDQESVLSYEVDILPFSIYEACYLFRHLSSDKHLKYKQSASGIMYEMWFALKYPRLIKDPIAFNQFMKHAGKPEEFRVDNAEMLKLIADKYRIKRK